MNLSRIFNIIIKSFQCVPILLWILISIIILDGNNNLDDNVMEPIDFITSQNNLIENYKYIDQPYSKVCSYSNKCTYNCEFD